MILCSECKLQKKAKNCSACRNAIGKLYLDFLVEVKDLSFKAKNYPDRVYAIQDLVVREEAMVNSVTPNNLKEMFKV